MKRPFKLGFIIGRFQHIHLAHEKMITKGLQSCDKVLLLVGSSQEAFTKRNPFSLSTRMELIRATFPQEVMSGRLLLAHIEDMTHEGDNSHEWGDFLLKKVDMWKQHYGVSHDVDCMIYGDDEERRGWFSKDSMKGVSHIVLSRSDEDISATKMRQHLLNGIDSYTEWESNMPTISNSRVWFARLKKELLFSTYYKELKGEQ